MTEFADICAAAASTPLTLRRWYSHTRQPTRFTRLRNSTLML